MAVQSLTQWLALPEIACPVVQTTGNKGSIYIVHKIGFLALSAADIGEFDTSEVVYEASKYFFPTAEVEFGQAKQLCRLPLPLSNWAIDTVAMARQMGKSRFPQKVEFGILGDRFYAEIL